jgi:uncharacterized protein YkwD
MASQVWTGGLVLLLLTQASAFGQRSQEIQSENTDTGNTEAGEPTNGPDLAQAKKLIVARTNEFRQQEKREPLKVNDQLASAAQSFAEYLARTDKFSHTADGKEPWERTMAAGYQHCIILENIAYQYNSSGYSAEELAESMIRGWKESPGHRRNMLDADAMEIGVGVARSAKTGRYYGVQDFGRRKSAAITFKVANQTDAPVTYVLDGKPFSASPGYTITHERCRPSELRFQWPENEEVPDAARKTFRPSAGATYTIRRTEGGALTVTPG